MGIINWIKDKRFSELEYEIKKLKQEFELLEGAFESLKTQINSIRSLIYRKKYKNDIEEDEKENKDMKIITPQELQLALLGLSNAKE